MTQHNSSPLKGSIYMILAATLWSLGGVLSKAIPFHALTISLVRGLLAAGMIGLVKGSFRFNLNRHHIRSGLFMFLTTVLFISANKLTTAANAIMLQYTSIIFIIILNRLIYHIKPHPIEKRTFLLVLLGMGLFFFQDIEFNAQIGNLLALGSGMCFAFVFVLNKHPNAQPLEATYIGQAMSIVLLPILWFDSSLSFEPIPWILLIIMGLVQLGLGYVFFAKGIGHISALSANLITTIEPILNPIWVFIFLQEVITWYSILGGLVIIGSILWMNVSITSVTRKTILLEN